MMIALFWSVMLPALAVSERCLNRMAFAIAALACVTAALLMVTGDLERATLLAAILAIAIVGASKVKYHHSGMKLTVADLALVFAGTIPFLVVQYRRTALTVLGVAGALALAVACTLEFGAGPLLAAERRFLLVAVTTAACFLAYRYNGGAAAFRPHVRHNCCFFSTFMASLIDTASWRSSRGLSLSDVADVPLPLLAATPARSAVRPDIIFIQHESIFDPRLFGLAIEPEIAAFLSPANGRSGGLNVDIYGGGSWQSEFSLLTGLSSASFGADAYFIFKKGAGRFHHSLPRALAMLGYTTTLASSCRRNFLSYEAFYRSIGMDEQLFSDDLMRPAARGQFEKTYSDAIFLKAIVAAFAARIAKNDAPQFLFALSNYNHGPHNRRRVAPGQFEVERAYAAATLPDVEYAEYYSRLAETAATWQQLKFRLASEFSGRPMLFVHYGDHQPVMTRRIERLLRLPEDERRRFQTFYAVEAVNFDVNPSVAASPPVLDIAFLGTLALQIAGLPLDPVTATRASLADDCGAAYFSSRCVRKAQFHRTLIDLGLIELATHGARRPPVVDGQWFDRPLADHSEPASSDRNSHSPLLLQGIDAPEKATDDFTRPSATKSVHLPDR